MYKKEIRGWLKHVDFMVLDLLVLQLSFVISYWMWKGFRDPVGRIQLPYSVVFYRYQAIVFVFCQLIMVFFTSSYKNILRRSAYREFASVIKYAAGVMIMFILYLFAVHQIFMLSRLVTGWAALIFVVLSFTVRQLNKVRILHYHARSQKGKRSLMLITTGALRQEILQQLSRNAGFEYFVSGVILQDQEHTPEKVDGIPTLGRAENILFYISRNWVDEVFIYLPEEVPYPSELVESLMFMGITVHYCLAAFSAGGWGEQEVGKVGNYRVLTSSMKMVPIHQLILKRAMDILGGLVGCLFTAIIFIFVAPAIYRKSPGPIFFAQERIGKNGKKFKMYKFRSMYMDAEERKKELMKQNRIKDGMMFKMDDDPRIIGSEKKDRNGKPKGIGNFIRNTSLDEFPQFWNVLKGDMSLVGTRPPTVDEWEKYDLHHRVRMSIKPGITGMWQVSGRSEITDFEEVVRLDREYIQNWSPELDISILFRTVKVVLKHEGAS